MKRYQWAESAVLNSRVTRMFSQADHAGNRRVVRRVSSSPSSRPVHPTIPEFVSRERNPHGTYYVQDILNWVEAHPSGKDVEPRGRSPVQADLDGNRIVWVQVWQDVTCADCDKDSGYWRSRCPTGNQQIRVRCRSCTRKRRYRQIKAAKERSR